jgi:hypothetical protein
LTLGRGFLDAGKMGRCVERKRHQLKRPLWVHLDVAGPAIKGRTVLALNDLKTIRYGLNGGRIVTIALRQARHAGIAAFRTPKFLVPFVGHQAIMH